MKHSKKFINNIPESVLKVEIIPGDNIKTKLYAFNPSFICSGVSRDYKITTAGLKEFCKESCRVELGITFLCIFFLTSNKV